MAAAFRVAFEYLSSLHTLLLINSFPEFDSLFELSQTSLWIIGLETVT
jgi:hypothetical protein